MKTYEGNVIGENIRVGIVVARFNEFITSKLLSGAEDGLIRHNVNPDDIEVAWVPGAFEIPLIASKMANSGKYDAVIALGAVIRGSTTHYDYVICDEIQDLSKQTLSEIKQYSGHLICAGDANQSIYEKDTYGRPVMNEAEARAILGVEPIEQNTIYRLTRSIVNAVIRFLPRMNRMREKTDYTKVDVKIACRKFISEDDECKWDYETAIEYANKGDRVAILFSTHKSLIYFANKILCLHGKEAWQTVFNEYGREDFNNLNYYLKNNNVRMQCVLNGYGDLLNTQKNNDIIITTYHSSKGLDFEDVYIPFVCQGLYLAPDEERSKTLLMVAMTRSSKNLSFTYSGILSEYIDKIKDDDWITIDMSQNAIDDEDIF